MSALLPGGVHGRGWSGVFRVQGMQLRINWHELGLLRALRVMKLTLAAPNKALRTALPVRTGHGHERLPPALLALVLALAACASMVLAAMNGHVTVWAVIGTPVVPFSCHGCHLHHHRLCRCAT